MREWQLSFIFLRLLFFILSFQIITVKHEILPGALR